MSDDTRDLDRERWGLMQGLQQITAEMLGRPVVFRDRRKGGGKGPEMAVIPDGHFLMGSPQHEAGRDGSEGPRHLVMIPRPFAIGRFAVTFHDYNAFCSARGRNLHVKTPFDTSHPVIDVNWGDAQTYCEWLSERTGQPYRLPTEAEWEYAARAGTTTPFHFGTIYPRDRIPYKAVPVGSRAPNAWGLHEVHGNVWEWVQDCWAPSYGDTPTDGSAWEGDDRCIWRVLRGGAAASSPASLRSATRTYFGAFFRREDIGFRVARSLDP